MDIGKMRAAALASFFITLALVAFYDILFPPKILHPEDVDKSMIGNAVIVRGVVTYIKQGNTTFMKLNRLPVVFFRNVSARKGDIVAVYGTVSEYHGKLEILGKRIYSWKQR